MTSKLPRSLLVGGATLSLGVLFIDLFHHALGDGIFYVMVAGAVGLVSWWLQKPAPPAATDLKLAKIDSTIVQTALSEAEQVITQLRTEVTEPTSQVAETVLPEVSQLNAQIAQIVAGMQRSQIRLAVIGGKGSGKTALIQQLQVGWATPKLILITETPSFADPQVAGSAAETTALARASTADLVLFLVTGDITESEFLLLKELAERKRTLLLLNKQDQFLPAERQLLLTAMRSRLQDWLQPEDIVGIAAVPNPIKVRQHQADGNANEWLEEQAPQLANLTERLNQILEHESERLVLTSSFGDAKTLKAKAQRTLNDVRRTRALPILEKYQWVAAASAFASPLPTLDMVATAAINAQMVMEFGKIYRQQFSLQQAQKVAIEIGSLMLKFGVVELSTQAIATLFKTNAITYVAGGAVQAVSAAYLTRLAGLSLIEYFSTQEPTLTMAAANPLAVERVGQILRSVVQASQQQNQVKQFVSQAIERLLTKPAAPTPLASVPPPQPISVENQLPAMTAEPLQIPLPEAKLLDKHEVRVPLSAPKLESST